MSKFPNFKIYPKVLSWIVLTTLIFSFSPPKFAKAGFILPPPGHPWDWRKEIEIKPGDILYDKDACYSDLLGIFTIGHVGMYVGEFETEGTVYSEQTIESRRKGVNHFDISTWDYPNRDNVYLLRVDTTQQIRDRTVDFVINQMKARKPYDWHWWQKSADPNSPSWYCSELVWAAYYNQGVDLEHHSWEEQQIGYETPYVSPAEIFEDEDTYIISCHSRGESFFGGILPNCPFNVFDYFQGLVFIFASPVDGEIIDPDGLIVNKEVSQIPGAYYVEDFQTESGQTADLIILPDKKFGQYQINVYPEPGHHSFYSLEVYRGGGEGDSVVLAENRPVPDEGQFDLYMLIIQPPTFGGQFSYYGFYDEEKSSENSFSSGVLDFSLTSSVQDFESLTPGQENWLAKREIQIINNGNLGFWYKIRAVPDPQETSQNCDKFTLALFLEDGSQIVQNLPLFETGPIQFSNLTDDLIFKIGLAEEISGKKKCRFKLEFQGWQDPTMSSGFFDKEEISNYIEIKREQESQAQQAIVINEFLPNPLGDECPTTGIYGEWVEIYNKGTSDVDLDGWYIKDEAGNTIIISNSNTHTASTIIGPQGSGSEWLVVFLNGCILNNNGDTLYLYDNNDQLIDSYTYTGSTVENKSYARYPDGTETWYDPIPTPGGPNRLEPGRQQAIFQEDDSDGTDQEVDQVNSVDLSNEENVEVSGQPDVETEDTSGKEIDVATSGQGPAENLDGLIQTDTQTQNLEESQPQEEREGEIEGGEILEENGNRRVSDESPKEDEAVEKEPESGLEDHVKDNLELEKPQNQEQDLENQPADLPKEEGDVQLNQEVSEGQDSVSSDNNLSADLENDS
jgi:hypothetical protein